MNIWRGIGDGSHLVAMILLLAGIWRYKSARTVSLRTQELYMAVFSTRYLDLWIGRFISYYNTSMKVRGIRVLRPPAGNSITGEQEGRGLARSCVFPVSLSFGVP